MGAQVLRTEDVTAPTPFDEPFTMTKDWIVVEETVTLPADGQYYVVAWDPAHRTGKLDVAVGTVEQFGPADAANASTWTTKTRTFHETSDDPPPMPIVDKVCETATGDADGGMSNSTSNSSCSVASVGTASTSTTGAAWLAAPLLLVWRRRRRAVALARVARDQA